VLTIYSQKDILKMEKTAKIKCFSKIFNSHKNLTKIEEIFLILYTLFKYVAKNIELKKNYYNIFILAKIWQNLYMKIIATLTVTQNCPQKFLKTPT